MPKAIPQGLHSVTPQLTVDGCAEAIETGRRRSARGVDARAPIRAGNKIWHSSVRIGDSVIFCNDSMPEMPPVPKQARLWLYQEDVDRGFERAKTAGLKVVMPPETCSGATASPRYTTAGETSGCWRST